ncbi:CLUMA_CG012988, isoform A [Clunio marinus]|uniref:CLUMA_CG012988, isoform A n=1 Tax=Clunio marinus TaxID=568069 RepID=A0A1J1IMI5_9DIPT|nr:CLUMA_CG012988, isoform A [Clunio marinus]
MIKFLAITALLVAFVQCQETLEEESRAAKFDERKEKRGIALNLGSGVEGYSYLGPSYARGVNRVGAYTPGAEYGYDGVNYGYGASNFAGGFQTGYQGYNQPIGSYPYRGSYPGAYSFQRQNSVPVNTYPLGGIGTVGPYGGAYGGFNGYPGSLNGLGFGGGYQQLGYQQPGYQQPGYVQPGYQGGIF